MTKSMVRERINNILSIEADMVEGTEEVHLEGEVAVAFKDDVDVSRRPKRSAEPYHVYRAERTDHRRNWWDG